jgi:hypothetical protein
MRSSRSQKSSLTWIRASVICLHALEKESKNYS